MRHLYSKFWWILFGRGLFGIGLGVLAFIWMVQITQWNVDSFGMTALLKQAVIAQVVLVLLGVYALMDGFFALVLGSQNYGEGRRWWSLIVEGLVGIALVFVVFFKPGLTVWVLYDWVIFWTVLSGLFEVVQAFDSGEYWDRRRSYLGLGLASIVFGLFLIRFSGQLDLFLVGLLGGYALFLGMVFLRLGLRFRHFSEEWKKIQSGAWVLGTKG